MKNFSLKALGAIIFAAGLVVAGVAAPANAAAGTASVTAFTGGQLSPAGMTYTTGAVTNMTTMSVYVQYGISTSGFGIKSTCVGTNRSFADCGITSIAITGGNTFNSASGVSINGNGSSGSSYPKIDFTFGSAQAGSAVVITFAAGAFTASDINSSFNFNVDTNGGANFSTAVNVSAARSTVMFYQNLSGSDMTMVRQFASARTALDANTFTNAGKTFSGWATSRNGSVAYADGASYNFTSPNDNTTPPAMLYAVWTTGGSGGGGGGGGNAASASLSLNATTGQLIAGSTVGVSASGLQSTAPYTVTVQSTPQTIGTGNAVSGAVSTNVTLPSGLEAGWHTLTFTSTASDGSAVESKYYFKISASGTLLSTSSTIPAELANTGINTGTGISLLAGGLSLALVGAEMFMIARRKRSN